MWFDDNLDALLKDQKVKRRKALEEEHEKLLKRAEQIEAELNRGG